MASVNESLAFLGEISYPFSPSTFIARALYHKSVGFSDVISTGLRLEHALAFPSILQVLVTSII